MNEINNKWLKAKGYLHISGQIDVFGKRKEILKTVSNPESVAKYAFYPLLHATIKERKFKKDDNGKRGHVHYKDGKFVKTVKERPLHYANHMDALIFGYYAQILQFHYERELAKYPELSDSIIAYRSILLDDGSANKGTIHFAKEVFSEIKSRLNNDPTICVLAFDIKSFFSSLDHNILKRAWARILGEDLLQKDHYNVFKAATRFSYILLDDLRLNNNRKSGFNEKELAKIRNKKGINAFFESPKDFREKIKSGEIKLYRYPFRNKEKTPIGIPQGLPISAILANLYLLEFDKSVYHYLVKDKGCFYRRYSDDIIIACPISEMDNVNEYIISKMSEYLVEISKTKTEQFIFEKSTSSKVICTKTQHNGQKRKAPLVYLGFEFNGNNTLIKSSNLSKFYRRMISSVKRKAKRAKKDAEKRGLKKPVIFRRQLYKLYTTYPLNKKEINIRHKSLVKNELGEYRIVSKEKKKSIRSNYLSYAARASEIMEEPGIKNQLRNHKRIFNDAVNRHLK